MKIILVIGLVISAILTMTEALRCLPCNSPLRSPCAPRYKLNCKGGLVKHICNCCDTCAQLNGETCGGLWYIYGKCDHGLTCYMMYKSYKGAIHKCICVISCDRCPFFLSKFIIISLNRKFY